MTLTHRETNTLALASQAMQLLDFGSMLVKSGMLPSSVRTPESAVAIMVKGMELGLPAMAALNGITVIQGKPTVSPQLMLSLINRSGQLENIELETGPQGAAVTMKRRGRTPFTAKFGPTEAKAMGLDTKDNYRKQAPVMYQWRAVAACARVVFPDVIDGLYTPEEMGADVQVDEDGAMTVQAVPAQQSQESAAPGDGERGRALQHWASKIGKAGARLTELGARDRATKALTRFQWRTDPEQAGQAYDALCEVEAEIHAALSAAPEEVKSDAAPQDAEALLTGEQAKALGQIGGSAGATQGAERAALWAYMLGLPEPTPTKELTGEQAAQLIELLMPLSPDERKATYEEAKRAKKGALL